MSRKCCTTSGGPRRVLLNSAFQGTEESSSRREPHWNNDAPSIGASDHIHLGLALEEDECRPGTRIKLVHES